MQIQLDENIALVYVRVVSRCVIRFAREIQYGLRPEFIEILQHRLVARQVHEFRFFSIYFRDDLVGVGKHPNESFADESGGTK